MRPLGWLVIATACSHTPPPKAPPAETPITAIGDIAGRWVTSDDLDWSYALTVESSGTVRLAIDRNKLGRCEEKGTAVASAAPRTFQLTFATNECNRDMATGTVVQLQITSFTGDSLTIVIGDDRRTYKREPKSAQ